MKYEISFHRAGKTETDSGQTRRIAIVDSAEDAIVMAAALASDRGLRTNRKQSTPGVADSVHVWARHKGHNEFHVTCFLCERDRLHDIIGARDAARSRLNRWKDDGAKAKARYEWGKAHFPPGKDLTDYWQDQAFKNAFFANDFTEAEARLKTLLQPVEAVA